MQQAIDRAVEALQQNGWCLLPRLVARRDADAIRTIVLEEERLQTGRRRDWVRASNGSNDPRQNEKVSKAANVIAKIGSYASYLTNEQFMAVVRRLLGGYVRVSSDFGIVTFPGNAREFWHSDWPYNQTFAAHIPQPYGNTVMHLGSLLMLSDFTPENGGTLIVPGSHRTPCNPTGMTGSTGYEAHPGEMQVTGEAGSVFVYDTRLWHSIAENMTAEPRVALAVRFAPWWLNLEVRRAASPESRLVEEHAQGRASRVPPLTRAEFRALPPAVRPLYEHWLADDRPHEADDRALYDLRYQRHALPMTQLALDRDVFEAAQRAIDTEALVQLLHCSRRAAEAMLAVLAAVGFLESDGDGRFTLAEDARPYLLRTGAFYRGRVLEADDPLLERLRSAFASDACATTTALAGDIAALSSEAIRDFCQRIDALARPAAPALASHPVFRDAKRVLDVAGGAGAMAIEIVRRNEGTGCTLLDRRPVIEIARGNMAGSGFGDRIATVDADMLAEPWPRGHDVVLLSNVLHNWDESACQELLDKAFDTLPESGSVVVHEILLDDAKDGPLTAACLSVVMLLSHRGKQYTFGELSHMLRAAGFEEIGIAPSFGYYQTITARKPARR